MARLVVFSHKLCWTAPESPSGYATDGGFPFQVRALSELFDSTVLLVPCSRPSERTNGTALSGDHLVVRPLTELRGQGFARKFGMIWWSLRNSVRLVREAAGADVIHAPIPGDVGTIGMLLAVLLRKPLFVRHCGNWEFQRTVAERFWRWFMERFAGGRNLMLATGGKLEPPSRQSPLIRWIFSTSLTAREISECRMFKGPINHEEIRLINVCRQERFKGTEVLLETLKLLVEEFPGIRQDVVGDGGALVELKQHAQRLGLDGHVNFHGQLDHEHVIELLKRADLFCYPTRSDGFPKAVLEALACGLPVIATPVSVLPELLGNGCGVVIEDANPKRFAQAVRQCLLDAKLYRQMSAQALATAEQYSLEKWRDTIGSLLREVGMPLRCDV